MAPHPPVAPALIIVHLILPLFSSAADPWSEVRNRMVDEQLKSRGIRSEEVLQAMRTVPRHEFVPSAKRPMAYLDRPLDIGHGQTISQPYIVAFMTEKLRPSPEDRVLEIGTGSGYQAAILSRLVRQVYTIEIIPELANSARETLQRLSYNNVEVRAGDGYRGWPERAPFDGVIVTAAPDHVPKPLIEQLKDGGRIVIPVGASPDAQELKILRKEGDRLFTEAVLPVRFVPLVREK
jgi:protein-L-isoaspartate(D-aspartate) O-methyltransferase